MPYIIMVLSNMPICNLCESEVRDSGVGVSIDLHVARPTCLAILIVTTYCNLRISRAPLKSLWGASIKDVP